MEEEWYSPTYEVDVAILATVKDIQTAETEGLPVVCWGEWNLQSIL